MPTLHIIGSKIKLKSPKGPDYGITKLKSSTHPSKFKDHLFQNLDEIQAQKSLK